MTKNLAQDGYSKSTKLSEGYVRKGGSNPGTSQVQVRPDAPAPMKPAAQQETGNSGARQGSGNGQS